jgi:hypothetical protein
MKRTTLAAMGCVALLGVAAPALSYDDPFYGLDGALSIRLGLFQPTDGTTQDLAGRSWFAFGVDYRLGMLNWGRDARDSRYMAAYGISIDFQAKDDFRTIPILLNYIGRIDRFFYSAGVGVGINNLPSSDKTAFAYQIGVGFDVFKDANNPPIFVEIKYHGSERSEISGFGAYVGVRF